MAVTSAESAAGKAVQLAKRRARLVQMAKEAEEAAAKAVSQAEGKYSYAK